MKRRMVPWADRRRMRVVAAVALVSATILGSIGATPAAAAEVVDQQSPLGPAAGGQSAWVGLGQSVAQPFTAGVTGPLTAVSVSLGRMSGGATNFTVSVRATSGGRPVGAALASKTFGASDVAALGADRTPTTVMARFATPATVTAGVTYAVVVSSTDPYPAYHWFVGSFCPFPFGYNGDETQSPTSWTDWPYASTFTTYVDGTPASGGGPGAPSALTANPGDRSADISFAQCDTGGQTITNYEYRLNGTGAWTAFSPAQTTSPVSIGGLTNGVPVTVELRAVFSGGVGTASSPLSVTPMTAPGPPTALVAQPADGQVTVAFTPGDDGGSAIVNYEFELDGSGTWTALSPSVTTSPAVITGLTNGVPVAIRLRAVSGYAGGTPSASISVTPGTPPTSGGGGGGGSATASPVVSRATPSVEAVTVPTPLAAGEGLVLIDGRSAPVSVQPAGPRTWRIAGEGFSMEFLVQAPAGGLDGRFTARAGSAVDVTGDGYLPGSLVATYLPGVLAASLGEERVRTDGTFSVRAHFPLMTGQYIFQVNGLATPTSVRSVNLGLTLVSAPAVVSPSSWSTRVTFLRNSAWLTSAGRSTIARFMRQHWTNASSAIVTPVVRTKATAAQRALAHRRAVAVVAAMRAIGRTQTPSVGPAHVDPRRARQVAVLIRR